MHDRIGSRTTGPVPVKPDEVRAIIEIYAEQKLKRLPPNPTVDDVSRLLYVSRTEVEAMVWRIRERWMIEDERIMRPQARVKRFVSVAAFTLLAIMCLAGAALSVVQMFNVNHASRQSEDAPPYVKPLRLHVGDSAKPAASGSPAQENR